MRLSAELNETSAKKVFVICFECETGVHSDLIFAAGYSKRSAKLGHPVVQTVLDSASNMAVMLNKTLKERENVTYLRKIADIPRLV
jgi:hypothetical protein